MEIQGLEKVSSHMKFTNAEVFLAINYPSFLNPAKNWGWGRLRSMLRTV